MKVLDFIEGDGWAAGQGDCVQLMKGMPQDSVHLTVTSIPFEALLTYSASDHDFGNCRNSQEFFGQFKYFVDELFRVTVPGRVAAIHCMVLPSTKSTHGFIGLRDFRGEVVRAMQAGGWIFHSDTAIRKDPVVAMQRTKALGLLWKQLKKDSTMSRTGINDYLVAFRKPLAGEGSEQDDSVAGLIEGLYQNAANHYLVSFRKPGENAEPVSHTPEEYPVAKWQNVAEPVWHDIDQTDTLQFRTAKDEKDTVHLAPLQKQVIERCIELWSNPGDIVFDPFGGIGSTPYFALQLGRRALMTELKTSYFQQAVKNLQNARRQLSLLDHIKVA